MERARDVDERVLEHALDAGGAVGEALAFGGLEIDRIVRACAAARTARRTCDEYDRAGRRLVLEVLRDERERAVRRAANQLADLVDHRRTAVGGESHDLVLVLVHREAEIGGEGRIQHAERMREPDLAQQRDVRAAVRAPLAVADRERRPLADAVGGQDRRAPRRRREERGGRVRLRGGR